MKTSDSFQVIDAEGQVIPGIYAVGGTTARDMIGTAGSVNFAVAAYSSLTATREIADLLK